jgi:hypothetical protein
MLSGEKSCDITYSCKQDKSIVQTRLAYDLDANPKTKKHSCPRQDLLGR